MADVAGSVDELKTTVKELERKISDLRVDLELAQEKLNIAITAYAGVKIGDIVRSKRRDRARFKVSGIKSGVHYVWISGHKELKGGGFSRCEQHLYDDWELLESAD